METIVDIARVCSALLFITILVLSIREAKKADTWTDKGLGIFIFTTVVYLVVAAGSLEKLGGSYESIIAPLLLPFIAAYGIKQYLKPGHFNKGARK